MSPPPVGNVFQRHPSGVNLGYYEPTARAFANDALGSLLESVVPAVKFSLKQLEVACVRSPSKPPNPQTLTLNALKCLDDI